MRLLVASALAAAACALLGCSHMTTKVPGVLDLRSDGALEPTAGAAADNTARSGFSGIMYGDGVQSAGASGAVTVEDRQYWILGLFPVLNDSATDEIAGALGKSALRDTRIGEKYQFTDFCVGVCGGIIPFGACVFDATTIPGSPRDFLLTGTRIQVTPTGMPPVGEGHPATETPSPTEPALPTPATSDPPGPSSVTNPNVSGGGQ